MLKALGGVLGLLQDDPAAFLKRRVSGNEGLQDAEIDAMIAARAAAKKDRDFAEADRIRDCAEIGRRHSGGRAAGKVARG